ncbi:Uncharacterised protein [Mycobacteroides abscessus subsp. abscessus]|nr:Uncharacterised protein [Mycobacteroides abscessus subsp. abscessus]
MQPLTKGDVTAGAAPVEAQHIGVLEDRRITIGRAPQQREVAARGQLHPAECGVRQHMAVMPAKWRLQPQCFFQERRQQCAVFADMLLQSRVLAEDAYGVAHQAGGRLAARTDQLHQDHHPDIQGDISPIARLRQVSEQIVTRCGQLLLQVFTQVQHQVHGVRDHLGLPLRGIEPAEHLGAGVAPLHQLRHIADGQPDQPGHHRHRQRVAHGSHPVDAVAVYAPLPQSRTGLRHNRFQSRDALGDQCRQHQSAVGVMDRIIAGG